MHDTSSDMHFLDPRTPVEMHRHHLPHWEQGDVLHFVSYHLADAIPAQKLALLLHERQAWLDAHPRPWDPTMEADYIANFSSRIDAWADAGYGACVLRNPEVAAIVAQAFHHFDGERYRLHDFIVMPNHVHVQFQLCAGYTRKQLMHSWRSYSAKRINALLGRKGRLWQDDYWDRIVRDMNHYVNVKRYIAINPAKAHLTKGSYRYWTSPSIPADWW